MLQLGCTRMPNGFGRERGRNNVEPRRHEEPPSPPPPVTGLLALQRAAGNQAVARMLESPGPQGLTLRERMAQLAGRGMADPRLAAAAAAQREEKELAAAFRGSVFYYGTVGGESLLKQFMET